MSILHLTIYKFPILFPTLCMKIQSILEMKLKIVIWREKTPDILACDVCRLSLIDMLRNASDMHVYLTSKEMK